MIKNNPCSVCVFFLKLFKKKLIGFFFVNFKIKKMSSEYSFCSENGFDEMSSSSDSGFDVSFESPKHDSNGEQVFQPVKDEKRKKTRNTRCKSPQQVNKKLNKKN